MNDVNAGATSISVEESYFLRFIRSHWLAEETRYKLWVLAKTDGSLEIVA